MKPVLLFDLGDTLVKYYSRQEFPPILRAGIRNAKVALEDTGRESPSASEVRLNVAAENYEAKNYRVRPLRKRLSRIFRVKPFLSEEEWLPICRAFLEPIFSIAELYDDTLPALDAHLAQGCRIGILSNCPWGAPSEPWFEELQRHGLSNRCEVAIFCSDVGWRKPAQPMFRHVLSHFGCKPEECLFVGDNPRWDTLSAGRARMNSVLIDRAGHADTQSGMVIQSLFDLDHAIERLV